MRLRRSPRAAVLALVAAVGLAGCTSGTDPAASDMPSSSAAGSPSPSASPSPTPTPEPAALACLVTDTRGVGDGAHNELAFEALLLSEEELEVEIAVLESRAAADFAPNIEALLDRACEVIITVGPQLGDATLVAAQANPDTDFVIVGVDLVDPETGEDVELPNVAELTFDLGQAAFLAGYLAAGQTESGVLGTLGAIDDPVTTAVMSGFQAGMDHHNAVKDTQVRLLGWDRTIGQGEFTGDAEDVGLARSAAESLLDRGADIVLPVAGPASVGAAEAVAEQAMASLVWVHADGCVATDHCELMLTSLTANVEAAVLESVRSSLAGVFRAGLHIGSLADGWVDLAPYRDLNVTVPAQLKAEVAALREAIVEGTQPVD